MSARARRIAPARLETRQRQEWERSVLRQQRSRHANLQFEQHDDPPAGQITLVSDAPTSTVTVLVVGELSSDGGVGGWSEITRDGRTPATYFSGTPRATLTIPAMIDRAELHLSSVEKELRHLWNMGRPDEDTGEPARIKLLGDSPVPMRGITWVLDAMPLGATLRAPDGTVRQQALTLSLSQWVDAQLAPSRPASGLRTAKGAHKTRYYTTHRGDTLRRIALQQLGSQARWKDVLAANRSALKSVDPDAPLRGGVRLRLDAPGGAGTVAGRVGSAID